MSKRIKNRHIKSLVLGLAGTTLLLAIYWLFFPVRDVASLTRVGLQRPEIALEDKSRSLTISGERIGGDIIIRAQGRSYHFPAKLWEQQYAGDSLLAQLQQADSVAIWLSEPHSPNALGLRAGNLYFSPEAGVADLNRIRTWFGYLIAFLYGAIALSWIRMKLFKNN